MYVKAMKVLLCASLSVAPSGLVAKQRGKQVPAITVTATPTVTQWTTRIGHDLENHLIYPVHMGIDDAPEGAVRIQFRSSEAGLPTQLNIVQSSRSGDLDRAALYAVSRISTLHPLPEGVTSDRTMEAWIMFASNEEGAAKMKAKLQRQAQLAAARVRASGQELALQQPLIIASR